MCVQQPTVNATVHESWYTKVFAKIYDPFMAKMEQRVLSRHRSRLLGGLTGNILEIGSGTGINFPLYPKGCHVIASEPSVQMLQLAEKRLKSTEIRADITLVHAGAGSPELEAMVPVGGFDAIVCTLVLCTIPDPEAAVGSFKHWLRSGGKLVVLEHVHANSQPRRTLHACLNPAWKVLAEGCHLTRDTKALLRKQGFIADSEEEFIKVLPFYAAVLHLDGN
jgi:ubiquinone/menaquinone biosynthesis C-methylase UbiE